MRMFYLLLRNLSLLCLSCALLMNQSNRADAASISKRTDEEARKLFPIVLAREKAPGRCQYNLNWDNHEIPDYVAKEIFHLTLYAGLVAPFEKGDYRSIIDPSAKSSAAFCSSEEVALFSAQQIEAFETSDDENMQIDRTLLTFPVFDARFDTAVVVVSHLALDGRFRWQGKIGRHPAGIGVVANVYKKTGGQWHLEKSIELEIS